MKVQLWCDMEGVAGITRWEQVMSGNSLYDECRILYTNEINAAVRGAKRAGATQIIVIDGHGAGGANSCNSFRFDLLESGAEYITSYRWGCYVEELKNGTDALLLPGAHAMAGTPDGVLCHTMSSASWVNASFNDILVGESGIIAAIAGTFDTPCVWMSGDASTCREVKSLIGEGITTCQVKKGLGRYSARSISHKEACERIEETTFEALKNKDKWPKPFKLESPVTFKVELHNPDQSVPYEGRPEIEIPDPRILISRADNAWEAWNQFWPRK